jgi:hypothetical protein
MLIDAEALKADLRSNVVEVTFTKINGETRKMRATLMPSLMPVDESATDDKVLLNEEDSHSAAIRVWDLDVGGWRSFRTDRVVYVQGVSAY